MPSFNKMKHAQSYEMVWDQENSLELPAHKTEDSIFNLTFKKSLILKYNFILQQ